MRLSRVCLSLAALALVTATAASAQEAKWGVRTRAIYIAPNASSTRNTDIDVKGDLTFEVDITRYFSPKIAAELILATAGHEVTIADNSAGSVNHLPPTLLLQFHPIQDGTFRPYIGAGANVTYIYAKSGGLDDLDFSTSFGYAGQVGADFQIGNRASFNVDGKYIHIKTKIESNGTKVADLKINPFVIGLGFGYKF